MGHQNKFWQFDFFLEKYLEVPNSNNWNFMIEPWLGHVSWYWEAKVSCVQFPLKWYSYIICKRLTILREKGNLWINYLSLDELKLNNQAILHMLDLRGFSKNVTYIWGTIRQTAITQSHNFDGLVVELTGYRIWFCSSYYRKGHSGHVRNDANISDTKWQPKSTECSPTVFIYP